MSYRCETCGTKWEEEPARRNGFVCYQDCGGRLGAEPALALLDQIPHPLALLLQEYDEEEHPYIKLHRLCDAAEMLTRFLTSVALAELASGTRTSAGWPDTLRQVIDAGIERPTFGQWVGMLREARACLPPADRLLVPTLPGLTDALLTLIGAQQDAPQDAILPLRNALAHDARWSRQRSEEALERHGHRQRFEALWRSEAAACLIELELLGVGDDGRCWLLRGVPPRLGEFPPVDSQRLHSPPQPGAIILARRDAAGWLNLTPLQTFGPVRRRQGDRLGLAAREATEAVPQVYTRRPGRLLEYTALHDRFGRGTGTEAMMLAFEALFPLERWRQTAFENAAAKARRQALQDRAQPYKFRDVFAQHGHEPFVGRDAHLDGALAWLEAHSQGVALVLGAPGMGKTAFALQLSLSLARHRKSWLCLRHFFKEGDARCSALAFMRGVLVQLELEGGEQVELPPDEHQAVEVFRAALQTFAHTHLGRGKAYNRLVLLVDGLDEVMRLGQTFFDLLNQGAMANVVWVGFGRPEAAVLDALPALSVERLFPDPHLPGGAGLPPLDHRAVREYLLDHLQRRRYELLAHEDDQGHCRFLDALTDRARSLPLYLRLLVDDLRNGRFSFDKPDELPASLVAYYRRLIDDFDPAQAVLPTILALLAIAQAPLSEGMLLTLLADHQLAETPEWQQIVRRALRLGHVMMHDTSGQGHSLYHETFRDYLRSHEQGDYEHFRMAPTLRVARIAILDLCRRWAEWPEGSAERYYALAFGPRHFAETKTPEAHERLEELLLHLPFLEAKAGAGMIFDLVADFERAVDALPPERPHRGLLYLLGKVLRRNVHFIHRHRQDYPQALLQCVWNHGWWYDCPEADRHYVGPAGQSSRIDTSQRSSRQTLHALAERWRAERRQRSDAFLWLRSLRPPSDPVNAGANVNIMALDREVVGCAFAPDSHTVWVAASRDRAASVGDRKPATGTIGCFTIRDGRELPRLRSTSDAAILSMAGSPGGGRIAISDEIGYVTIIDGASGEALRTFDTGHGVVGRRKLRTLPPGRARFDPQWFTEPPELPEVDVAGVRLQGLVEGQPWSSDYEAEYERQDCAVRHVCWSPDGAWLVTAGRDGDIRVWSAAAFELVRVIKAADQLENSGTFFDGLRCGAGTELFGIRGPVLTKWRALDGALLAHTEVGSSAGFPSPQAFRVSADGKRVAAATGSNCVTVWDAMDLSQVWAFRDPNLHRHFTAAAFSADGRRLWAGTHTGDAFVFDVETGSLIAERNAVVSAPITALEASSSGHIAIGVLSGQVSLLDREAEAVSVAKRLKGHRSRIEAVLALPRRGRLVTASRDHTAMIWDASDLAHPLTLLGHTEAINCLAVDRAEELLATGGNDGLVMLWNLADGTRSGSRTTGMGLGIGDVQISPDRRWIAAGGNHYAWVWPTAGDDAAPRTFSTEADSVHQVVFDPASEFVFVLHAGHVIDGWRIADGMRVPRTHLPLEDAGTWRQQHNTPARDWQPTHVLKRQQHETVVSGAGGRAVAWYSAPGRYVAALHKTLWAIWAGGSELHFVDIETEG